MVNQDIFQFASDGDLDSIKVVLMAKDIDINQCDSQSNYSPLIWASTNGHTEVVKYFLSNEYKGNDRVHLNLKGGWNGSTALIKAAENNKINVVEILLCGGADLDLQNDYKSTALMLAAERGYVEIVNLLARNAKTDLQNEDGYTALILAVENGHALIVKILCEHGANEEIGNKFGKTALIIAAEFDKIDCLRILLGFGGNVNHTSKRGMTALMLATVKGYKECVEVLLEHRADVNINTNWDDTTALAFSFSPTNDEDCNIARLLIAHGADKDYCNKDGVTILMRAAEGGKLSIIDELLKDKNGKKRADYCNRQDKDGGTALHYAASKGHVEVFIYLMYHVEDTEVQNKDGKFPLKLLTDYYVENNKDEFRKLVYLAHGRQDILKMIAYIIPYFKSPYSVLDLYFHDILYGISVLRDVEIVTSLVHLAVGIKKAYKMKELEKPDLIQPFVIVENMLMECMMSDFLNNNDNVVIVFQDNQMRCLEDQRKDVSTVRYARGFMEGPLSLCIQHELLAILGTRQVAIHVDSIFYSSLQQQKVYRPIYSFGDIFQMRSNFVNLRTCPAVNFNLDGISRLAMFVLIGVLVVNFYISSDNEDGHSGATYDGRATENMLIVMVVGTVLHEIGEFQNSRWSLKEYFKDTWNYLDFSAIVLLLAWLVLLFQGGSRQDFFPYHYTEELYNNTGSTNFTTTTTSNIYSSRPTDAIACLATSAVPMSIGLLQYLSTYQDLGQFVLTVFGLGADLGKFLVVFMVSIAGFGIAFHGMFAYTPSVDDTRNFHTVEGTMYTLFDAALGQHDFGLFANDDYHIWGIVLFFIFITMMTVILLNLVFAGVLATFDKVKQDAGGRWCLVKARLVQTYLLIEEGSPLSMLPAPLNLIPAMLLPLHYLIIALTRELMLGEKLNYFRHIWETYLCRMNVNEKNEVRALSLCGTVSDKLMSLVLLIPFTFNEIDLCLRDIKKQVTNPGTFYMFFGLTFYLFPIILLLFGIVLLIEIYEVKSILEIDENGHAELKHKFTEKKREETTPEIHLEDAHIRLNITIIRADLNNLCSKNSYFSKPELFTRIKVTNQLLITQSRISSDMRPLWNENKVFLISLSNDDLNIEISVCDQYDGRVIGIYKGSMKTWIANRRYEGDVTLTDHNNNNMIVGQVLIVVKVSKVDSNNDIDTITTTNANANTNTVDNNDYRHSNNDGSSMMDIRPNVMTAGSLTSSIMEQQQPHSLNTISHKSPTEEEEKVSHTTTTTAVPTTMSSEPKKKKVPRSRNIKVADISATTTTNELKKTSFANTTTSVCEDMNKNINDKEIFTLADRERIFHGIGSKKMGNSHFRKIPFDVHTEIKQLLREEINQLLELKMKQLLGVELLELKESLLADLKNLLRNEE